jgi:hypothetical protein
VKVDLTRGEVSLWCRHARAPGLLRWSQTACCSRSALCCAVLCCLLLPAQMLAAARQEEFERWKGHLVGLEAALQAAQSEATNYRCVHVGGKGSGSGLRWGATSAGHYRCVCV